MTYTSRRGFLGELGSGLILASLGMAVGRAAERGIGLLDTDDEHLDFGELEPLAALLQECDADVLVPRLAAKLREGVELKTLVAAAALANARTFGGEDYTGYHCAMALAPALELSQMAEDRRLAPLPVLKTLHRNTARIRQCGGRSREVLRKVAEDYEIEGTAERLRAAAGRGNAAEAEASFANAARDGAAAAFAVMQPLMRDNLDVHQVVLVWRAWDLQRLTGERHAVTLMRQAVRQCVDRERSRRRNRHAEPASRARIPALVSGLPDARPAPRALSDGELEALAGEIFAGSGRDAAAAAAQAIASGVSDDDIGEALSLASARLLLHDPGHSGGGPKPRGSVHGASIGVHASDSAHAWRRIAAVLPPREAAETLITGAWHTGGQAGGMDRERPIHAAAREAAAEVGAGQLLPALSEAIRGRDQKRAAALAERYARLNLPPRPIFALLAQRAVEDDGALHHEKFFATAWDDYRGSRPAFRWLRLAALARVVASGYGFEAPGVAEAKALLEA